jgi:hypothetical protein
MFSLLVERDLTEAEFQEFLHGLFPEMKFKICSSFQGTQNDDEIIVTVDNFTNVYKTKIDFWLDSGADGIAFTQYVGEKLSLIFECDTVTEVQAEGHPFDQYNSLLIRGMKKFVINDDGIEFDDYHPKLKYEWTKRIEQFDSKGCLQQQL